MYLELVRQCGKCPACGHALPDGPITQYSTCAGCGIVFSKYRRKQDLGADTPRPWKRLSKAPAKPANKQPSTPTAREQKIDAYVEAHRKSAILAFLLALLFGPLGMLYVSIPGALGMILFGIVMGVMAPSVAWLIGALIWLIAMAFAPSLAWSHNDRMRSEAELLAGGRD